jgi:hypothetical protein
MSRVPPGRRAARGAPLPPLALRRAPPGPLAARRVPPWLRVARGVPLLPQSPRRPRPWRPLDPAAATAADSFSSKPDDPRLVSTRDVWGPRLEARVEGAPEISFGRN